MVRHVKTKKPLPPFETFMVAVAIIEPLSTVPQIVAVYTTKDAHAISLLSWLLFIASSVIWLIYGIRIRSWPLIVSSIMWLLTEIILLVGILLYS